MSGARRTLNSLLEEKQTKLRQRHPNLPAAVQRAHITAVSSSNAITLGRDESGLAYVLPERPRLEHMHVIGATGSGKTNFLEHMIRQDVARGRGVCVVDPHGSHPDSLYRSFLAWLFEKGYNKTRIIHLIDPNALSHTVGFNPLDRADSGTRFSVIAEAMFEAFERMWGDEDGNSKPTIQRVLTATFTALGEQGLTLAEARLLFDPDDAKGIRALVLSKLEDSYAYEEMEWLHRIANEKSGRRDFRAEVIGPLNRLAKLTRTEAVRAIVGQTERLIDLREALDEGHIILANLSGGEEVYEQGADLLGRLLTRFIFFHARRRQKPHVPYFLYLDECHRYLSGDLPNLLAEVRKYGLAVTLSHQWLAQLGQADTPIREAVCKGPNLRAVFRIKDPREAADLAEMVVPLNLEIPVQRLMRPAVVGHRRARFNNASSGQQAAKNWSLGSVVTDSTGTTHTESTASTETESHTVTETASTAVSEAESRSVTETDSKATSETESHAVTETASTATTQADSFSTAETESVLETDQESFSSTTSESVSEAKGKSIADSRSTSIGESLAQGSSDTRSGGSTANRGSSDTIAREPPGMILRGNITSVSSGLDRGASTNVGWASGSSRGESSSEVTTTGRTATETQSTTIGRSTAETEGRSHATTAGRSTSTTVGHSTGRQEGRSIGKTVGRSDSNQIGRSVGRTVGNSISKQSGKSFGTTIGNSIGTQTGKSVGTSQGRSIGKSATSGGTTGTNDRQGYSEGIEPMYETLPTAVHSKENAVYMAAQTLRSLTTGRALINYVGQDGMNTGMIAVPKVQASCITPEQFDQLRAAVFAASPSAVKTEHAIAVLEKREQRLIAAALKCNEVDEPETFRVPMKKGGGRA